MIQMKQDAPAKDLWLSSIMWASQKMSRDIEHKILEGEAPHQRRLSRFQLDALVSVKLAFDFYPHFRLHLLNSQEKSLSFFLSITMPPDAVLPCSCIRGHFIHCPLLLVSFRMAQRRFFSLPADTAP